MITPEPHDSKPLLSPDGLSYWDGRRWVSLVSPDGRSYWNGRQWVRLVSQQRVDRQRDGPSAFQTAFFVIILLAGSLWVLNNTQLGVSLKCRFLGDAWACLTLAVDQLVTPQQPLPAPVRTESPEERLHRQEEEQRSAAASAVRTAISDLESNADDLDSLASDLDSAAGDVGNALTDMQSPYDALAAEVEGRPMDSFQQDEVCFALDDVAFARDDIDYAVDSYQFVSDPYESSALDRTGYVLALDAAVGRLTALVGNDQAWKSLLDSAASARLETEGRFTIAQAAATEAADRVQQTVAAGDELMKSARKLAKTAADCL